MKSLNSWITSLIMLAIGIVLIVLHNRVDILQAVVTIVGIALLLPLFYSLFALRKKNGEEVSPMIKVLVFVPSLAAFALGIWMIFNPVFFVGFFAYLFGAILVGYGILRIGMLIAVQRDFYVPLWFYVIPVLILGAGLVILCSDVHTLNEVVVLMMGISLVASAVNDLSQRVASKPRPDAAAKEEKPREELEGTEESSKTDAGESSKQIFFDDSDNIR